MAYYKLDPNGQTIPPRNRSRKHAEKKVRGETLYHYMLYVSIPQEKGKYKYIRKRVWLPNDEAAAAKARELKFEAPAEALTWSEGFSRWRNDKERKLSEGHLAAVGRTMAKWTKTFGSNSTIEGTALPSFTEWIAEQSKDTKGRGAQLHQSHLLTIARWCRSRGYVTTIPFDHAPMPEATLDKKRAATIKEFMEIADLLPPQMYWMWWMLGLTGMRISAACTLLESDIGDTVFTVTTKGNKRVEYPISRELRFVIDNARQWKAGKGFTPRTLFCSHRGKPWKHYAFSEQLRKRAEKYKITPHQLRHMAGTMMAEDNLAPDIIQAGLAHDDRSSSEVYIDKTMPMRTVALTAVSSAMKKVQIESKFAERNPILACSEPNEPEAKLSEDGCIVCPCCSRKIKVIN